MAAWKLAPALAAGNCTVLKPASPTPWSILKFAELIADVVPPGVINIITGPGGEIGKALATSPRREREAASVIGDLEDDYAALCASHASRLPSAVAAIGWQLEELRVSLFAQALGTAGPVSAKRVAAAIAALS